MGRIAFAGAVAALALSPVACGRSWSRKPAIVTPGHAAYVRVLLPTDVTDQADVRVLDEECSGHLPRVRSVLEELHLELHRRLQTAGFAVMVDRKSEHDVEVRVAVDLVSCAEMAYKRVRSTEATVRLALVGSQGAVTQIEDHEQQLQSSGVARKLGEHFMNDVLGSPAVVQIAERAGTGRSQPTEQGGPPTASAAPPQASGGPEAPTACKVDTDCAGDLVCEDGACKKAE